jgi:hypothetical protein
MGERGRIGECWGCAGWLLLAAAGKGSARFSKETI